LNISTFRLFIITLLQKTENGTVSKEELMNSLKITGDLFKKILEKLEESHLVNIDENILEISLEQRLNLAVRAIKLGASFENISSFLSWLEFEELTAYVFEENGFHVNRRFRFQAKGRRWEIDVLATCSPYIICTECKHWSKIIGNSTARGIIETHLEKVEVLSKSLSGLAKRIGVHRWKHAILVPATLTLSPTPMNFYRRVPAVSIHALPRFIDEFHGQLDRITHFNVELPEWKPKPKQTKLR
jgi:hypothetical protein